MRAFTSLTTRLPRTSALRSQPAFLTHRPLSTSLPLRFNEEKRPDPQEVEQAKHEQLRDGEKKPELQSGSEAAVQAEEDGRGPEELQRETAREKQKEHPEGKN